MQTIIDIIVNIGVALFIVMAVAYVAYMIGLIIVLRRMHKLSWMAFVPLLNYYAQVQAIGAPKRWFVLSLPPYIGAVYAGSVAIRLGQVFNRGTAFSLVWLTLGAPVGMFVIAFSKTPMNEAVLAEPARLLDIKVIKRSAEAA